MSLSSNKKELISQFQSHQTDTGSTEVQVALLTAQINQINVHLKNNKHDYSAKRGLLKLVAQRRKLLKYLNKKSVDLYQQVIAKLGLRK